MIVLRQIALAASLAAISAGLAGCANEANYPTLPGLGGLGQTTLTPEQQQAKIKELAKAQADADGQVQPAVVKTPAQ